MEDNHYSFALDKSIIVVAHPDDEILWFSSVLNQVDKVIICYVYSELFPDLRSGRIKSLKEYPLDSVVCLNCDETNIFDDNNWIHPEIDIHGLSVRGTEAEGNAYKENFFFIKDKLKTILSGYENVFTHNPWGEYGHEEHVQLFCIVRQLQEDFGYKVWFPNYCSNKSSPLMFKYLSLCGADRITLETNRQLAAEIRDIYKKNNCWTWYSDWNWMNRETFFNLQKATNPDRIFGVGFPLNLIKVEPLEIDSRYLQSKLKRLKDFFHLVLRNSKKIISRAIHRLYCSKHHRAQQEIVSIRCETGNSGNVLISYVLEPFLIKEGEPLSNRHTNHWESMQIAKTFIELGYNVDVVDYDNFKFVPTKKYDIFVSARTNLQRIAGHLNENCIKIAHLDMAHWIVNNALAYQRLKSLQERRCATLGNIKFAEINWAIESADYATVLGNQFTIDTYRYAKKPLYRIPISTCDQYPSPQDKDFEWCKRNFLWFGSGGLVHKGLDLVLEAFADLPDHHLYVFGPISDEKDFENIYRQELYHTENIHTEGWIDVSSQSFIDKLNNCIAIIYPSCAEGGGGAVINCMHAGLVPIVSYEASVDVGSFGVVLKESSIEEIKASVRYVSSLPAEKLKIMSMDCWHFVNAQHTRENFAIQYKKSIAEILQSHATSIS